MNKSEKLILSLGFIVSLALGLLVGTHTTTDRVAGDSVFPLYIKTMVSTAVTVGPQSTTLLAPSGGRIYAIFGNTGTSTQTVYLSLNGGTATTSSGIILTSGQSYVIGSSNQYVGNVTAISSSGTSTVTLTYSQ